MLFYLFTLIPLLATSQQIPRQSIPNLIAPIFYPPTSPIQNRPRFLSLKGRRTNNSPSPFFNYLLLNHSTCITPGVGRVVADQGYKTDCYHAAALLVKEQYNITITIGNPKYKPDEPMGCYLINNMTQVVYNQHHKTSTTRPDCSADFVCVCKLCSPGTYRNEGGKSVEDCVNCPAGYKNGNVGSIKCDECADPGGGLAKLYSVAGSTDCGYSTCPIGTEIDASRDSSLACYNCTNGKFNIFGLDGKTSTRCKFCKAGTEYVDAISTCIDCEAGLYQGLSSVPVSQKGQSQVCNECIAGLASTRAAADCEYTPDTCPPGTEKKCLNAAGNRQCPGSCKECLNGKFTAFPGTESCEYCSKGKEFTSSSTDCTWCVPGMYQNTPDADRASIKCSACAVGTASIINTEEHVTW